jgi:hypothetical protein
MTEKEMQLIANAIAAFYNVANEGKYKISPEQTAILENVLRDWKNIISKGATKKPDILLLNDI